MAGESRKMFESHLAILDALLTDIRENPSTCINEATTLDFFWIKISLAVQCISKSATNLCMAFSQPEDPASKDEAEPLLKKLESDSVSLVAAFYTLSPAHGITLKKLLHDSTLSIVEAVRTLIQVLQNLDPSSAKNQLQRTGSVWECCDAFKNLPRDNLTAVLSGLTLVHQLVGDALEEFEDARRQAEDGGDNDQWDDFMDNDDDELNEAPAWTEKDKQLHGPVTGLVKTTKACLKKTSVALKSLKDVSQDGTVSDLDTLKERIDKMSPAVDDLMAGMYPPMESHDNVKTHAQDLYASMRSLLEFLRQSRLTQNSDESWMDFLSKACDHNYQKLEQIVSGD